MWCIVTNLANFEQMLKRMKDRPVWVWLIKGINVDCGCRKKKYAFLMLITH